MCEEYDIRYFREIANGSNPSAASDNSLDSLTTRVHTDSVEDNHGERHLAIRNAEEGAGRLNKADRVVDPEQRLERVLAERVAAQIELQLALPVTKAREDYPAHMAADQAAGDKDRLAWRLRTTRLQLGEASLRLGRGVSAMAGRGRCHACTVMRFVQTSSPEATVGLRSSGVVRRR
mgnify:CR=1 FL=1